MNTSTEGMERASPLVAMFEERKAVPQATCKYAI
jgi:hypothetical protein